MHRAHENAALDADMGQDAPESTTSSSDAVGASHAVGTMQAVRTPAFYEQSVKPWFDRICALLLLLTLSPVMAGVALLVRLRLGQGVIYRQYRIGQHGTPFMMYKFRTMEPDRRRDGTGMSSPDRRGGVVRRRVDVGISGRERRRQERDRRLHDIGRRQTHKTVDDPRHTRLGRFLRASSLDELPQLFNVLRGELSLVGPRPELPEVVANYRAWEHRRHHVRPGITGLWQVTERANHKPMHEHVDTDLRYVDRISAVLDARILLLTVPVLLGIVRGGR